MAILVTGGLGYIGSHTVVELLQLNKEVIVIDNLYNSKLSIIDKIKQITNKSFKFYNEDILNEKGLSKIFNENNITAVIHFAGYKSVKESMLNPLKYYYNNVSGTINLLNVMQKYNCNQMVFSSTACVYGEPKDSPVSEDFETYPINIYANTKLMVETILKDISIANEDFHAIILRYFNVIGAHETGLIGEEPNGELNNIMPYMLQVALGNKKCLNVFGNDYNTQDGTCIRDYIHVQDLSLAHIKALEHLLKEKGTKIYNVGTGKGSSVLELITAFEKATGIHVEYKIGDRRPGDAAQYYANCNKINMELNWQASKNIEQMCKDSWNFIQNYNKKNKPATF